MLRKLEKYEIIDEIGLGGMATVYRARDSRLDRDVALKVMHPHLRGAREARIRFAREARSVARLHHPNILEIYDSSEEDSEESFIVTELLTGPTLKVFAENHPDMPAEIAACFAIQIAQALACAHDAGIVHRDVKPENVLLHQDRTIKLTDFGIAQMVDAQSFTATGQILGSPGHMAPEQVESGDCDARTDVFALGTVLYYLATARLPYSGRNTHQVLKRIMDGDHTDPLRARPTIGGRLRSIIVRCLARQPDDRFQSIKELEEHLEDFVAEVGIDDPRAMLERYLRDPEGVAAELRTTLVDRLTALGRSASDDGDVALALDHFNRVLAIDDGNERVLSLIEQVGRRRKHRAGMLLAGGTAGLLGVCAIAYALVVDSGGANAADPIDNPDPQPVADVLPEDAAVHGDDDAGQISASAAPDRPLGDAGPASDAPPPDSEAPPADEASIAERRARAPHGPRNVVFRPTPQNVAIGVDGAQPRQFGPSFREVELSPGPHRFRFEGGAGCCEPVEFSVVIPPGPGDFTVSRALRFRPARLYVVSQEPANVSVGDGLATGRTRSVLNIPMESFETVRRITVTAPGRRAYTTEVRLRAGQLETVTVALQEAPGGPP